MIFSVFSVVVLIVVAVYLVRASASMRRRSKQSWESLTAQLQPDWSTRELIDVSVLKDKLNSSLNEKWELLEGARGLWVMHQNAGVMMEMADFAARNNSTVDREVVETLRSDAMKIKQYVLIALAQYAMNELNEATCMNAYRAASTYMEMARRLTQAVQESTGAMLPDFVAAM